MPSFSKMAVFPVGYYRNITAWLLRERRDVVARISTLTAEMDRIGLVKMHYRKVREGKSVKATAERTGFSIAAGTTLGRLMQAYIATGGNPMSICGFLSPDSTLMTPIEGGDVSVVQEYPGGGAPGAMSVDYNDPLPESPDQADGVDPDVVNTNPKMTGYEGYRGGMIDHPGYIPGRLGSRMDRGSWDSNTVTRVMHDARKWNNQAIKRRLQDKEWQIIKLSDLYEQLLLEREETLMEAFGGQLNDMPHLDDAKFDPRRLVQVLIADMYGLLFDVDESNIPNGAKMHPEAGHLYFVLKDVPGDGFGGTG